MEAISYVNIFETKGLEYLIVISFLLGFVLLVRHLTPRTGAAGEAAVSEPPAEGASQPAICIADVECPYRAGVEDKLEGDDRARQEGVVA